MARTTRFGVWAALAATLFVAACADEGPLAPAAQAPATAAAPQVAQHGLRNAGLCPCGFVAAFEVQVEQSRPMQ